MSEHFILDDSAIDYIIQDDESGSMSCMMSKTNINKKKAMDAESSQLIMEDDEDAQSGSGEVHSAKNMATMNNSDYDF